ncbi:MAG: hypothetical protein ACI4TK_03415 [Agathobacter sp.]
MKKKLLSLVTICVLAVATLVGCGTATTDNSSASNEYTSIANESLSSTEETSSTEEVDTRLTKEIIIEYIDENKSDLWVYEEDKYTDDLYMNISFESVGDDYFYMASSNNWSVLFVPTLCWNDEANALVFDPYLVYSNAWFLSNLSMYDEIQIATDNAHMTLVIDEANVNYDLDYSQSSGSVYMTEEDIDDMKQLLEMLEDNPSVRLNPVNAEEIIEFYLTDTMIMQFKETIMLYLELQEVIR